jgi:hypothetical protein
LLAVAALPFVVLLVGALVTVPGVAGADAQSDSFGAAICADGTMTAGERTATVPARTPLLLSIQPCAGTDPETVAAARWGAATYFDSHAHIGTLGIFPFNAEGPTTMETMGFADGDLTIGIWGRVRAVCLITGVDQRVACVRVNAVGAANTILIEPLAVDDPLVTRTVTISVDPRPDPACGACV